MVFKIGDQVKYNGLFGAHKLSGIIRSILNEADIMNTQYLVEFEGWNKGHTGKGLKLINSFKTNVPNCWYCLDSELELIVPVVICDDSIFKNKEMEESKMELNTNNYFKGVICDDSIFKNKEKEESKMDSETIKTFNKNNLKAGKELAEKEKADYETQMAKEFYTTLITKKQNVERGINAYQEELDKINKELSVFK